MTNENLAHFTFYHVITSPYWITCSCAISSRDELEKETLSREAEC